VKTKAGSLAEEIKLSGQYAITLIIINGRENNCVWYAAQCQQTSHSW